MNDATWFQRILLPGLAFKAVVIGGGYATGRELAEYFLPAGPVGGLAGMALAMAIWSGICATVFAFAYVTNSFDYHSVVDKLLGRGRILFEFAYVLLVVLILAVFSAVAGEIGSAIFDWPKWAGSLCLAGLTIGFAAYGNSTVERLLKYASVLIYVTYAVFIILILSSFGDRAVGSLRDGAMGTDWVEGGITYASYNIIAVIAVLPTLRHLRSKKDALLSGLVAGPLAMLPAILFFIGMIAFYPDIGRQTLPSDFLLGKLNSPAFHYLFQIMIFTAVLESSVGTVHSINERLAMAWRKRKGREMASGLRAATTAIVLAMCIIIAGEIGLVDLVASGYRVIAYVFLAIFILPLLTVGIARIVKDGHDVPHPEHSA